MYFFHVLRSLGRYVPCETLFNKWHIWGHAVKSILGYQTTGKLQASSAYILTTTYGNCLRITYCLLVIRPEANGFELKHRRNLIICDWGVVVLPRCSVSRKLISRMSVGIFPHDIPYKLYDFCINMTFGHTVIPRLSIIAPK